MIEKYFTQQHKVREGLLTSVEQFFEELSEEFECEFREVDDCCLVFDDEDDDRIVYICNLSYEVDECNIQNCPIVSVMMEYMPWKRAKEKIHLAQ